jgi:hypothetical protein
MDIHNSQFGSDIEYKSQDRGTPAWAIKSGPGAIAPIPEGPPTIYTEETFDSPPVWDSFFTFCCQSGDGVWAVASDSFHSAPNSWKSPALSSGQSSTFTLFNDFFAPDIIFWARVDTANQTGSLVNGLIVKVDGVEKLRVTDFDTGWLQYTIDLSFGYQVDFIFQHDFSAFVDSIWIDNVVFGVRGTPAVPGSPAHPKVYAPLVLDSDDNLNVVVNGTIDVEIRPLDCTTDSVTICPGDDPIPVTLDEPIEISGTVTVNQPVAVTDNGGSLTVDGPLTDGQLRATPVPVSGPLTDIQLRTTPVPISGIVVVTGLPEVEIKNDIGNPVPVSGTITALQGVPPWLVIDIDPGAPGTPIAGSAWSITHAPAVNTIATATQAAPGLNKRLILTSLTATLSVNGPPLLTVNTQVTATSGGTIWSARMSVGAKDAGNISPLIVTGMVLPGAVNTAITIAFSVAPGAAVFETITASGYVVAV